MADVGSLEIVATIFFLALAGWAVCCFVVAFYWQARVAVVLFSHQKYNKARSFGSAGENIEMPNLLWAGRPPFDDIGHKWKRAIIRVLFAFIVLFLLAFIRKSIW